MALDFLAQIDPVRMTPDHWKITSEVLHFLWFNLFTVIGFATLLLFAHAVIPSAINSGHVPEGLRSQMRKMRFPMYALAVGLIFLVAWWFSQATHNAYDIKNIYDRWWM
jgi:hypothetical protein